VTTCGAGTRIAVKLILINYLMVNLFGFYHGNPLGEIKGKTQQCNCYEAGVFPPPQILIISL